MPQSFYGFEEARRKLGISADELTALRQDGTLKAFRDGASFKFRKEDVDALARERGLGSDPEIPLTDIDAQGPPPSGELDADLILMAEEEFGEELMTAADEDGTIIGGKKKKQARDPGASGVMALTGEDPSDSGVPDHDATIIGRRPTGGPGDSDVQLIPAAVGVDDDATVMGSRPKGPGDSDVMLVASTGDGKGDSDVKLVVGDSGVPTAGPAVVDDDATIMGSRPSDGVLADSGLQDSDVKLVADSEVPDSGGVLDDDATIMGSRPSDGALAVEAGPQDSDVAMLADSDLGTAVVDDDATIMGSRPETPTDMMPSDSGLMDAGAALVDDDATIMGSRPTGDPSDSSLLPISATGEPRIDDDATIMGSRPGDASDITPADSATMADAGPALVDDDATIMGSRPAGASPGDSGILLNIGDSEDAPPALVDSDGTVIGQRPAGGAGDSDVKLVFDSSAASSSADSELRAIDSDSHSISDSDVRDISGSPLAADSDIRAVGDSPIAADSDVRAVGDSPIASDSDVRMLGDQPGALTADSDVRMVADSGLVGDSDIRMVTEDAVAQSGSTGSAVRPVSSDAGEDPGDSQIRLVGDMAEPGDSEIRLVGESAVDDAEAIHADLAGESGIGITLGDGESMDEAAETGIGFDGDSAASGSTFGSGFGSDFGSDFEEADDDDLALSPAETGIDLTGASDAGFASSPTASGIGVDDSAADSGLGIELVDEPVEDEEEEAVAGDIFDDTDFEVAPLEDETEPLSESDIPVAGLDDDDDETPEYDLGETSTSVVDLEAAEPDERTTLGTSLLDEFKDAEEDVMDLPSGDAPAYSSGSLEEDDLGAAGMAAPVPASMPRPIYGPPAGQGWFMNTLLVVTTMVLFTSGMFSYELMRNMISMRDDPTPIVSSLYDMIKEHLPQ